MSNIGAHNSFHKMSKGIAVYYDDDVMLMHLRYIFIYIYIYVIHANHVKLHGLSSSQELHSKRVLSSEFNATIHTLSDFAVVLSDCSEEFIKFWFDSTAVIWVR